MLFPNRLATTGVCCLLLCLLIVGPLPVQAQTSPSALSLAEQQALMAQQARQQVNDRILAAGGVPLEGALDPAAYIVGPGDVFSITTGGAIPLQIAPSVTADGVLVVPSLGSFPVAGLSLTEARARVITALQRSYRNVPIEVALAQPRQFYVHVSGEVARPGRHVAVPVARVEDALAAAMEDNNPLQALERQRREYWNYDGLPALRNVMVERQTGERIPVDLMRYYATGDTQYNPYLRDGDRLYVPTYTSDGDAVFVEYKNREILNRMTTNGTTRTNVDAYDFRPGDTVTDLLLVAGGPSLLNETSTIRLMRNVGGALDVRSVDVQAIIAGTEPDVSLQPRDRLLIPDALARTGVAEVDGLVVYPGTYPIVAGETTLRDLVVAAGGVLPEGLLRAAYLERRGAAESADRTQSLESVENPAARDALIQQEIFKQARLTDLSFVSRQYLTRELLQFQRVSLELGDDVASIPEVPLRDGDRFVVPRDPDAVLVIGQVQNPGYVPFRASADAAYYIEQAGGQGPAAAEVYLREAGSGALRSPANAPIRSGDALFVDREPMADTESLQALALQERQLDFQRLQERSNRRFQYIQTGLAIVGTAVGLVTTYLLIQSETSN
ncbi:MAG: SLBB domain-containing protein [Rhodothermales bacterium]